MATSRKAIKREPVSSLRGLQSNVPRKALPPPSEVNKAEEEVEEVEEEEVEEVEEVELERIPNRLQTRGTVLTTGRQQEQRQEHYQASAPIGRVEIMRAATARLKLNQFGLPEGIFRTDLLPSEILPEASFQATAGFAGSAVDGASNSDGLQASSTQFGNKQLVLDVSIQPYLEAAYTPLSYAEGFPTLPSGLPLWSQLEFEPDDAYFAFEAYVNQGLEGARQLFALPVTIRESHPEIEVPKLSSLQEWFHLYYWGFRTKAYDMFNTAALRKARENRILTYENRHFLTADRLLDRLLAYMGIDPKTGNFNEQLANASDFWDSMTPRAAIDFLKSLIGIQRVSLGLPAGGPQPNQNGGIPAGASMEVVMRHLAGMMEGAEASITESPEQTAADVMRNLMKDPKAVLLAQELTVRYSSGGGEGGGV